MNTTEILDSLRQQFNNRVAFREKRKNIYQLVVPLFHEDGDMVDIFIELSSNGKKTVRVSDFGKTLMRLSYSFEIDTPNKERIYRLILSENHVEEDNGKLYVVSSRDELFNSVMQLYQVIAKVSNMRLYKREVIRSLFFEMLTDFIMTKLQKYNPVPDYYPIEGHEEYKVDFCFNHRRRPVYVFGISDSAHARLATISVLKFMNENIPFKSTMVLEDLDVLGRKDQARLMSAADKEFPSLDDFQENAEKFLERELLE
jgi:hypothetical protein